MVLYSKSNLSLGPCLSGATINAEASLLVMGATQPALGNAAGVFSKIALFISVLIFAGGSVICAISRKSLTFVGGRAVSGLGSGGIMSGAMV